MKEQSNQPQNPPAGNEQPEVYSVSQDKDGSFHFSRRDFLYASAAIGGTLLLRGICPRFGAKSAPSEPVQAGMSPLPRVYIHTAPSIASNIADTLQQNDFVRLISDHPDLGWVEVATRSGQHGWVKRSFVDFSRAIKSSSPNFSLSSTLTPTPTQTHPPLTFSIQLRGGDNNPRKDSAAGQAQSCGEAIQNGDFEAGQAPWVEYSTGTIIRDDWSDPYEGSWVAWFGGPDADERLTQLFHVPADAQDAQTLEFYLQVTTEETGSGVYDRFRLRFLDAGGNPISNDIQIANNTTPTDWVHISVNLNGMAGFADQDIQIQFECVADPTLDTFFVLDSVSLDLTCGPPPVYVYLPLVVHSEPSATPTPTSTPRPSATPCPSYCSSDCPSDCTHDCPSDCVYICPSDCTFECIYDCPFDCIYYCSYDW
jgi:hypothetical protein